MEVIILPFAMASSRDGRYPLRGTPVTLLDPVAPVADSDWEAVG